MIRVYCWQNAKGTDTIDLNVVIKWLPSDVIEPGSLSTLTAVIGPNNAAGIKRLQVRFEYCYISRHTLRIESLWILLITEVSIVIFGVISKLVDKQFFLRYPSTKNVESDDDCITSPGEKIPAIGAGCAYGNVEPMLLITLCTKYRDNLYVRQHRRHLHNAIQLLIV